MSKAALIREWLETTAYSSREIAKKLGVSDSYVRAVTQRRDGGGKSEADRKYYAANRDAIIKQSGIRVRRARARRKQQATHASG